MSCLFCFLLFVCLLAFILDLLQKSLSRPVCFYKETLSFQLAKLISVSVQGEAREKVPWHPQEALLTYKSLGQHLTLQKGCG
jgi:hypothetical protein